MKVPLSCKWLSAHSMKQSVLLVFKGCQVNEYKSDAPHGKTSPRLSHHGLHWQLKRGHSFRLGKRCEFEFNPIPQVEPN